MRPRGTGSVVKLRHRNKAGVMTESRCWYALYYNEVGKQIHESSRSEEKNVAEALLARRLSEVGQIRVSARIQPKKTGTFFRLNNIELQILLGPCVYIFYGNGQCLYIGSASSADRPLGKAHHLRKELAHADEVLFKTCQSRADAFRCEAELIAELKPILNRRREVFCIEEAS